jgi:prolyl oligopeptidase
VTRRIAAVLFLLTALAFPARNLEAQQIAPMKPPVAQVRPVTDDYFGTKVVDNYRYFENLKDPEVQQWMKAQADYTEAVLGRIPGRERFLATFRELDASQQALIGGVWPFSGARYFYVKRFPQDTTGKLYERIGLSGAERLLIDPGKVILTPRNHGKGSSRIESLAISDDGRYIAAGITPGGAGLDAEVHIFDVASARETGDVILGAPGGDAHWLPDNRSFVYSRQQQVAAANWQQKERVYRHILGTDQRQDRAEFGYGVDSSIDIDSTYGSEIATTPGSRYVLGRVINGALPNEEYFIASADSIDTSPLAWRKVAGFADQVTGVAVHGDELYLFTFKDASHFRILRTDARHPDLATAEVAVPASAAILRYMALAHDALYVTSIDGGVGRLLRVPFGPHPTVDTVALPYAGIVSVLAGPRVSGALVWVDSWTKAGLLYAYNPLTRRFTNTGLEPNGPNDDPTTIESVEVKVKGQDGTLIPLSIIYPRGLTRDGSHPTLLSGYGAYGVSQLAGFDPTDMAAYERGVVRAICHVRGGGEYGEEWHLAGKGPTKPNTWRDFIACAEYLIANGYTSPAHLAGEGVSAGGIMIGRAIEERPDLFAAAVAGAPIADMLRYETTANGGPNIPEFGSTKTEAGFRALYAMSAYANVKDGMKYPAVLVTTGANDQRVAPWEAAKFAARLHAATASGKPVLLRVDYRSGHGATSTEAQSEQEADTWSFLLWQLGDPAFQPRKP